MIKSPIACPRCGQRARVSSERVVAAVATAKHPLTTMEVAAALRAQPGDMSTRLTKLAQRGLIKREYRSSTHNSGGYRYAVWSGKAAEVAS